MSEMNMASGIERQTQGTLPDTLNIGKVPCVWRSIPLAMFISDIAFYCFSEIS